MREFKHVASKVYAALLIALIAFPAWAQSPGNVTLQLKNTPLLQALQLIKQQAEVKFIYSDEELRHATPVTAEFDNVSVQAALNLVLLAQPYTYEQSSDKVFVIKPLSTPPRGSEGQQTITGKIVDAKSGDPLIGASILDRKSLKGTVSGTDGTFALSIPNDTKHLAVSYVGYDMKTIPVSGPVLVIALGESKQSLDEVVVVAYGSSNRKDLTGSVTTINTEELRSLPAMTIDDAMTGKAAGVQIIKADGSPGGGVRMRVRGGASLTGTSDPLYIIDGIPTEVNNNYIAAQEINNPIESYGEDSNNTIGGGFTRGLNSLSGLNINDIESISILKDASATALYGSKAANGVVIITTKKGKRDQKPQFNFNYYMSYSDPITEKVMNASQYKQALRTAAQNTVTNLDYNLAHIDQTSIYEVMYLPSRAERYKSEAQAILDNPSFSTEGGTDTDWVDLVTRTGSTHNIDFSVSGGSQTSRYYTSLNYTTQDGTLIGTDFERISGKISVDTDFSKYIHSSVNLNFGYTKNHITSGVYTQALSCPPIYSPYNEDGSLNDFSNTELGNLYSTKSIQNPLALAACNNEAKTYVFKGTYGLEFDIMKDLKFKTTASADYQSYRQTNFMPSYVKAYETDKQGVANGSEASSTSIKLFFENVLTYSKVFNENHRLNALLGTSWENQKTNYFAASGKGYPDDNLMTNLGSAQTPTNITGANPSSQTSLLSFYARLNYVWKERYLFTVTGRSDASSKFSKSNRTGYFPSAAVAWRMSEESFLKDYDWIDEIKLRGSIGRTGNQSIGDNMYRTLYNVGAYAGSSAFYPGQLGNADIKWESTTQRDLGLDFSFFKGRLGGTLGYYHKITKDALINVSLAPSSGYTSVMTNIANVRNVGYEIELYGDFIRTKNFTWSGAINISHNKSKVLKINSGDSDMFSDPTDRKELNLGTSVIKEGEPLGLLCGYKTVTIHNEEELAAYKKAMFNAPGYYSLLCPAIGIGCKVNELDADTGSYEEDVIGNSTPKFFGGYTNTLRYKNWGLMAHFTFSYGNDLMYMKDVTDAGMDTFANRGVQVLDGYTPENPNFSRGASLYGGMMYMRTDQCVYDGSYLKLKSLSLSYSVPKRFMKKFFINDISVYATATNLFTLTSYPGADPEVSDDPTSIIGGGRDVSSYPTSKTYTFGIRLGF